MQLELIQTYMIEVPGDWFGCEISCSNNFIKNLSVSLCVCFIRLSFLQSFYPSIHPSLRLWALGYIGSILLHVLFMEKFLLGKLLWFLTFRC